MEAEHTALLCYCETPCLSHPEVRNRVSEVKEELAIL
jgi:hypothetical protein